MNCGRSNAVCCTTTHLMVQYRYVDKQTVFSCLWNPLTRARFFKTTFNKSRSKYNTLNNNIGPT